MPDRVLIEARHTRFTRRQLAMAFAVCRSLGCGRIVLVEEPKR